MPLDLKQNDSQETDVKDYGWAGAGRGEGGRIGCAPRLPYLALHLALLLEPKVLWSIGHTGEARFGVVPKQTNKKNTHRHKEVTFKGV